MKLLILFALLSVSLRGFTQETVPVVELPARWEVGTSYDLELEKTFRQSRGGKLRAYQSTTTQIKVRVLESRENGHVFSWTFGKTEMPDAPADAEKQVEAMSKLWEGVEMKLVMNESGSFVSLANEREILEELERTTELVEELLRESGMEEGDIDETLDQVRRYLGTEAFTKSMLEEVIAFYKPAGGRYVMDEPEERHGLFPNPYGGAFFPSTCTLGLTEINEEEGTARIDWRMELDSKAVEQILAEDLAAPQPDSSKDPETLRGKLLREPPGYGVREETVYVYDLTTGVPRSVEATRTTDVSIWGYEVKTIEGFRIVVSWSGVGEDE